MKNKITYFLLCIAMTLIAVDFGGTVYAFR